ncbi:MAG: alpha/beta fold hydrolase [Bradyrhizobiaceae bacterium]|nr:alpha/beta fold hydrolase [Bradyrhizobiaceae bacterium]
MSHSLPTLLVPGLACSARLYAPQIPALWQLGPVMVADNTADDSVAGIARTILANAPPRFRLAGLSMGGYISLEIVRQAPDRVERLALLDTSARPETPEQTQRRLPLIKLAKAGRHLEINNTLWPVLVHASRHGDRELRATVDAMMIETGAEAVVRQFQAIISRVDSRPTLPAIRCPTLVIVGEGDQITPVEFNREIAAGIPGARLEILPACGHLSTLEKPDEVSKLLVTWFSE